MFGFRKTFYYLKELLRKYSKGKKIIVNQNDTYCLDYPTEISGESGTIFAYVQVRHSFVDFYFQPLEGQPALLRECSPWLKRILQLDNHFHFKTRDCTSDILDELSALMEQAVFTKQFQKHSNRPESLN